VLVLDGDHARGEAVVRTLVPRWECRHVRSLSEAFAAIGNSQWEAAVVSYSLGPGHSGLELLQGLREIAPRTVRLLYSEHFCDGLVHDAERLAAAHAVVDARPDDFPARVREMLARLAGGPEAGAALAPSVVGPGEPVWFEKAVASQEFGRALRVAARGRGPVFIHGEEGCGTHLAAALFRRLRAQRLAEARGAADTGTPATTMILAVPPLRERIEDLPALAHDFLARHARASGEPERHLTNEALAALSRRPWRGNVRELNGVLLRACQRAGSRLGLSIVDLPPDAEPQAQPSQRAKNVGQRDCVLRQLRAAGHVSGAARLEGISRTNYIRLMRRLGIVRAEAVPAGAEEPAEAESPRG
jgi:DNA-binding NtrC family response regulator